MKETLKNFDLSDNLYYADQFGSIEQQIKFLNCLSIHWPRLIVKPDGSEYFMFVRSTPSNSHSRMFDHMICQLFPSISGYPRSFHGPKVLDIRQYLEDRFGLPTTEFDYFD